jgi:hypothetical protein
VKNRLAPKKKCEELENSQQLSFLPTIPNNNLTNPHRKEYTSIYGSFSKNIASKDKKQQNIKPSGAFFILAK